MTMQGDQSWALQVTCLKQQVTGWVTGWATGWVTGWVMGWVMGWVTG
jgi:hypothetical protein